MSHIVATPNSFEGYTNVGTPLLIFRSNSVQSLSPAQNKSQSSRTLTRPSPPRKSTCCGSCCRWTSQTVSSLDTDNYRKLAGREFSARGKWENRKIRGREEKCGVEGARPAMYWRLESTTREPRLLPFAVLPRGALCVPEPFATKELLTTFPPHHNKG